MSTPFTADQIPDMTGRTVLVTGSNSGIGYHAALALTRRGAHTILACRDVTRGAQAASQIRSRAPNPNSKVDVMPLDLADLSSVRTFAAAVEKRVERLDLLINNAGVMALPRRDTKDGFEMQFGTNHLGHFVLTGLLLPRLRAAPAARIVTVSSWAHMGGRMPALLDELAKPPRYSRWGAYMQSKLANLLFMYELDRRLRSANRPILSVGCHPGYAATNLQSAGARMRGSRIGEMLWRWFNRWFAQDAANGALPTLYAAVGDDVAGGDYAGPGGLLKLSGAPTKQLAGKHARDPDLAARLWNTSEALTGMRYEY